MSRRRARTHGDRAGKQLAANRVGLPILLGIALLAQPGCSREAGPEDAAGPAAELQHDEQGNPVIALSSEAQARLAVRTTTLAATEHVPALAAWGRLLHPGVLADRLAELGSAEAEAGVSRAEAERVRALFEQGGNASLRSVEFARAQALQDKARVVSARVALRSVLGASVAALSAAERHGLLVRLLDGQAGVARVSLPAGTQLEGLPGSASLVVLGRPEHRLTADSIEEALDVDPTSLGRAFLLRLSAAGFPLRGGAAVLATLRADIPAVPGVVLPSASVFTAQGNNWAWVRLDAQRFVRRPVNTDQPLADGWFVTRGFLPGDEVVTTGAQALLSEELRSAIPGED